MSNGFVADGGEEVLRGLTENSKTLELYAKLNLLNVSKLLVNNVDLNVRFILENSSFFIKESSGASKLNILDARLYIKHFSPNNEVLLYNNQLLATKPCVYEANRGVINFVTVPAGLQHLNHEQLYTGVRPSVVIFGMIPNKSLGGDRTSNPYKFEQHKLKNFNFVLNGSIISPFEINTETGFDISAQAYSSIHQSLGYAHDKSLIISQNTFKTQYFLLAADVSRNGQGLTDANYQLENCSIGFNASFNTSLTAALSCFLYLEIPSRFDITGTRQVIVKY